MNTATYQIIIFMHFGLYGGEGGGLYGGEGGWWWGGGGLRSKIIITNLMT